VFSRWETFNTRTTSEKSEKILKKAEAQFFSKNGEYCDIPFEFQIKRFVEKATEKDT
jgi:hypothetical protein